MLIKEIHTEVRLMSFAFARQRIFQGRRALVYGLGLFSFGAFSAANYFSKLAADEKRALGNKKTDLENFTTTPLTGKDAFDYPWYGSI